MLTRDQERKVMESIQECERYIAKEEGRSDDLRPADVVKLLQWYKSHKQKLINMLGR